MESHRQLEDLAAAFLAKRDSGDWADEDQAGLTRWIEASTANRVAFLRLEAVWEEARRLKALGAGVQPGTVPPPGGWQHSPFFDSRAAAVTSPPSRAFLEAARAAPESPAPGRAWRILAAAAASIVLAVGIAATYFMHARGGVRYSTPIGEVASVPLQDGSNMTLNTSSRVRVDLSREERRINLERGEAFFVVAKDPKRPFVVEAGTKRVVAVGTQFSVRRDRNDIRVVVTEGTVRVEALRSAALPEAELSGTALTAGTIAHASDGDVLVQKTSLPQAEEVLSWRLGYLTFRDTNLTDAVEEFNRYNTHRIAIADPQVASIRISGTFRPTNYEAFVRLLEEGFSIHARNTEEEITLTKD